MSSNIDENDLDLEASVSSVNSDSEKVDSTLIKIILSEMKSEFNRGTAPDESNGNDESSPVLAVSSMDTENNGSELANEEETEEDRKDLIPKDNFNDEDEVSNEPVVINELDGEEQKPRLILTLRTTEESREMGGRLSRKSYNKSDSLNTSLTDLSDSSLNDRNDDDTKGSLWETRSRRSLRSSNRLPEKEVDTSGMKRSSRRFSKEQCRESVLQNAIARKEKSFSSFNQTEERSSRRGARSPRQSFGDSKANRPVTRSKSPKSSSETCDIFDSNTLLAMKSESDFNSTRVKSEIEEMSGDSNDTTNINSASTNSQTSEPSVDIKPVKTDKIYTKTGKRRAKYFKGLKYSLTTGGSVKKKNLNMAKKKKNKNVASITAANLEQNVEYSNEGNYFGKQETDGNFKEGENNSVSDLNGKNATGEPEVSGGTSNVSYEKDEVRCESPALGDVCLSSSNKRKYQPERESESEKRCLLDVPSPCQGDAEAEPDKPEATAIGVGSAGLCLCNSRTGIYASTASCRTDLYCHAVDLLDTRLIGCCNTVDKDNALLLRPSSRVPFLVMCEVHYHRLQRHNCCPGCGVFCTQGKFMQCGAYHQYHKDCQVEEEGKEACPHCGSDQVYEVEISLGAHKYPVFFPQQTPSKKTPSAKMTFTYKTECSEEEKKKELEKELNLSLVPPSALILPSGLQISSQGLPPSLDKDKLEHLLHVACSIDVLSLQRYTVRNMYQASKHGEAEKIVHMIAAGLNVNHVFREYGMGTCLHAASLGGYLTVVHLLLQAGAHTDVLDRDQNTPLMLACANSHNDVAKYLVKAGASVTFKGGDGMTALHLAAKAGNVEACHYLISNPSTPRSFIDSVDDGRWTPLVWAAEHKHYEVIKFLLEKRADPLVRDAEQNIALHWAALSGCIDISEALLNYGSDVNSTNAHADTPLHIAARQNAYECVVLLLTRGARVDMHNRLGHLPLDCVPDAPNDTYNAIKLNVEMRNLALNVQKRTFKILTNDITKGYESNPVQCVNTVDNEPEPTDFVYVTENCFTSNINVDRTISSLQSCKCRDMCISGGCMCSKICLRCWYDDEGKLLPEFNFADPPMLFECNQACACNKLMCKNRVVQHGITARFQLFRTKSNKGWGVRTLRIIPKGAYVCEYIGEIISDCEADTREDDSYLFDLDNRDGETYCIDARRYGNIARFINHSCAPNLLPVRIFIDHQDLHFPRIAFFANRDIQANEELGFDYGEKFWIIKSKLFTCTCGAEKCKYSETTIEKTLAKYNQKMQLEDSQ